VFSTFVGILVLFGWVIGSTALTSPVPRFISMKPNVALGLVLIGGVLWFSSFPVPESKSLFCPWFDGSWLWR